MWNFPPACRRAVLAIVVTVGACYPQTLAIPGGVGVLPVQGNVYMLVGAGGNITLQAGRDGVLVVDSGLPEYADRIYSEIRKLTTRPLRYIVNTHAHFDHTGGNEALSTKGATIAGGNVVNDIGESAIDSASIVAHENVLRTLSAKPSMGQKPISFGMLPTDTFTAHTKELFLNGEAAQIFHVPNAHTDGDVVVFFRKSDVVAAGDIVNTDSYPFIDVAHGGSIQGIVKGLNLVLDLTVPAERQEGGTMVVPGHGRLCDEADVVEYRDMITIIRDRVQAMISKNMTLEQVKAAKPSIDYDPRFGSTNGSWTTDMFIEAVYNTLRK